jgi:predicted Zn finger-like uncharacterized protein
MGYVTTCPTCATSFKLVPDLLRISGGWVRCGKCAEVFDASAALLPANSSPSTGVQPPEAQDSVAPDVVDENTPEVVVEETAGAAPDPEPSPLPGEPVMEDRVEPHLEPGSASMVAPSFMHDGEQKSGGSRVGAVWLWLMLVLATVALALQITYQERDRIAAVAPQLHPVLAMACAHVGCVIGPVKQIESVVIEASSFNRLRADSYRLALTLRNTAGVGVALPGLDLALTDSADQVVMRRVFLPQDYAQGSGVLAPHAEWSGQVSFLVRQGTAAEKFTGYRLYAFYP